MDQISYKVLYDLAVQKLVDSDWELNGQSMTKEDWNELFKSTYEQDKQSLTMALEEYAIFRKLWEWMEQNNYHTNRHTVDKFCFYIDEESAIDEYGDELIYHLHTRHLWLSLVSKADQISFTFPHTFEVWGSRKGEDQMYDMFVDESHPNFHYITLQELMTRLQDYCTTKDDYESIITQADVRSNERFANLIEGLKKEIQGKSLSF